MTKRRSSLNGVEFDSSTKSLVHEMGETREARGSLRE